MPKKNWIKKVTDSIKRRGTEGVCTGDKFGGPTCRPGTKRYNLAKTFKNMSKKKHKGGGVKHTHKKKNYKKCGGSILMCGGEYHSPISAAVGPNGVL
tara:strand:+ start:106 stop:396 length:291 start_codon:yes stop_codon:yes gene_type:complete